MPTPLAQFVLFLSSYAPLFAIMALLDSWGDTRLSILSAGLALLSVIALIVFYRLASRLNPHRMQIASARPRDSDAIAYLLTYIVPFVSFVDPSPRLRWAILALLVLIAVLYIRAYLFYVNPWLALVGFRLFEAETDTGRGLLLLTRRHYLKAGIELSACSLSDYVFIEVNRRDGSQPQGSAGKRL